LNKVKRLYEQMNRWRYRSCVN